MTRNPIPPDALEKHIALLGGTGSGKTSAAKTAIVEPALIAGERVLVIDPTSAWWGLRLGRDGKAKGFPIYIFGGDHGDYPLRARDAEILADAFGTSSDSAVFDTSLMTVAERTQFFTDFAEAIRRKNRGPLKIVIDEAHLFMPQSGAKSGGAVPAMLHAGNNLVSLGRSRGLRITLISQRPAKLHKDSLTQVQSLVAMRLMAPQDRAAIADWIADQADPARGKEIIASLPTLKPGEGWVWAPLAGVLERVAFQMPRTFDSSRAPDAADGKGPSLAPINLDALKGKLATVEAEVRANDPKALKAELAALKKQMAEAVGRNVVADPADLERACAEGWHQGHKVGIGTARAALKYAYDAVTGGIGEAQGLIDAQAFAQEQGGPAIPKPGSKYAKPMQAPAVPRAPRSPAPVSDGLPTPHRRVLASLSFWASVGHDAPTREQVAGVAGYSPGSGGYNNILGALSTAGMIDKPQAGRVALSASAPHIEMDATEAKAKLLSILSGPEKKVIDAMAAGDAMTRDEVADASGYSAGSGGFNNIIGHLNTLCVLTKPGTGTIQISDWAKEVLQ